MRRWIAAAVVLLIVCLLATAWLGQDAPAGTGTPLRSAAEAGLVLQEDADGVWVMAVKEGSAAERADIRPGDYLESVRDMSLRDLTALERLWPAPPEGMTMTLRRDGVCIHTVLQGTP